MRRWCRVALIGLAIVIGSAWHASAQYLPTIKEATAFGGGTFNGSDETTIGGALAVSLTPRLSVEAEGGAILADETIINVNADLVFNLGSGTTPFVPYFIGGAGMLNNGGTDIALNAGLGFKLFVEPSIALRIDFRGFFTSNDGDIEDMERIYGGLLFLF